VTPRRQCNCHPATAQHTAQGPAQPAVYALHHRSMRSYNHQAHTQTVQSNKSPTITPLLNVYRSSSFVTLTLKRRVQTTNQLQPQQQQQPDRAPTCAPPAAAAPVLPAGLSTAVAAMVAALAAASPCHQSSSGSWCSWSGANRVCSRRQLGNRASYGTAHLEWSGALHSCQVRNCRSGRFCASVQRCGCVFVGQTCKGNQDALLRAAFWV
jgi:hypothetical protein